MGFKKEFLTTINSIQIDNALTIAASTAAYAAGDSLSTLITMSGVARKAGGSGLIQNVLIGDASKQDAIIDVIFFKNTPSSVVTDNVVLTVLAADLPKIVGCAKVSSYFDFSGRSIGQASNVNLPFQFSSTVNTLYALLVNRSTPTYSSAADISLSINILQD